MNVHAVHAWPLLCAIFELGNHLCNLYKRMELTKIHMQYSYLKRWDMVGGQNGYSGVHFINFATVTVQIILKFAMPKLACRSLRFVYLIT